MIDENTVRRIASTISKSFIMGNRIYIEDSYFKKLYRPKFEAGLAWLYINVLDKRMPKVVYCKDLGFMKQAKNNMDTATAFDLNFIEIEKRLHEWILSDWTHSGSTLESFKQEHNFDAVIDEEFEHLFCEERNLPFTLFSTVATMLYKIERNGFNLALFLREIMSYSIYKIISECHGDEKFRHSNICSIELENVKNLCNTDVFHVFFGQNIVYALCYPHRNDSCSVFNIGYEGHSSWVTFRPYFYWPYGPKIYASDGTRALPNWIFEEYLQKGYFKKMMDANDEEIRLGITYMIWKREGKERLMNFLTGGFRNEELARRHYLQYIDAIKYVEQDE